MILRLLARHWPILLGLSVLISAYWWIDRQSYQRAKADAEQRQLVDAVIAERKTRRIENAIAQGVEAIDGKVGSRIEAIRVIRQTVINTIEKEVRDDPRYSACALSDSVFEALNRARAASGAAPVAGQPGIYVPIIADAD